MTRISKGDKARDRAKVTQQEIADTTGPTKNYISSIERGAHKCNAQTFLCFIHINKKMPSTEVEDIFVQSTEY